MKQRLSSFDVAAISRELSRELEGARVQKTYQVDDEELRVRFYAGERVDLVVSTDRVHLTQYPKPAPKIASNFSMAVRKRTQGGFVRSVEQYEFDRVLAITIETKEQKVDLVVEMFGDGNIVVVQDGTTRLALNARSFRNRKVVPGQPYGYPPARLNPSTVTAEELNEVFAESDSDLVRTLATELGLGGLYAEEVVARSGLEKHIDSSDVGQEEVKMVLGALSGLFEGLDEGGEPQVVYRDGEPFDAVPLTLERYGDLEREYFDTFSEALDLFYSSRELEKVGEAEEAWKKDLEALESRLRHQREAIEGFVETAEEMRVKGDLLYAHYGEVEQVLEAVRRGKEAGYGWDEIEDAIRSSGDGAAEALDRIEGERCEVVFDLDGENVAVDFRKDVPESASELYEAGKKAKGKRKGAKKAVQDTLKKIEEVKEKGFEPEEAVPQRRVRMPEHWYHRFRWFHTSDGYLAVAGRNASQNEELVKNHLEKGDLFLHTDVEGAPATILKEGQDASDRDVEEAATFCVSNSAIWKAGMFSGDVYAVEPDQVSKTPESGEYLPKGSFVIRGKRRYFRNTGVSHCVGLTVEGETRIVGGPCTAIQENAKYWVELEPGDGEKGRLARDIVEKFREGCDEPDRRIVQEVATQEAVARALPPGKSRVVSTWT